MQRDADSEEMNMERRSMNLAKKARLRDATLSKRSWNFHRLLWIPLVDELMENQLILYTTLTVELFLAESMLNMDWYRLC